MRFLALDTETTGTNPRSDRIIDLCILEVTDRLDPVRSWIQRFNPGTPIPEAATQVHGIRDQDVQDAPSFASAAGRIQGLLADAVVIACNGRSFDVPLLHAELVRAGQPGLPLRQAIIDPYQLFLEDRPGTLIGASRHYLQREHEGAHNAEADVRAMLDVLRVQWAVRHHRAPHLDDLVHREDKEWLDMGRCFYRDGDTVRLGFGKHKGKPARQVPEYLRWMMQADFASDAKDVANGIPVGWTAPADADVAGFGLGSDCIALAWWRCMRSHRGQYSHDLTALPARTACRGWMHTRHRMPHGSSGLFFAMSRAAYSTFSWMRSKRRASGKSRTWS
ncbi:MAG: 3'-5' exonuclease [Halobacteriales archaeon]|nr:3'-5' exonuclease [Halobacteriales archaeon]